MARNEIMIGGQRIRVPRVSPTEFSRQNLYDGLSGLNGIGAVKPIPAPTTDELLRNMIGQLSTFQLTQILKKTMVPRAVTVGTTPTRIILSRSYKGYIIVNPESILTGGAVEEGSLIGSGLTGLSVSGDGSGVTIGVSNYKSAHIWLDIISRDSGSPQYDFYLQARMPISTSWADVQLIFPDSEHATAVGTYYKFVDMEGIAENMRIRWVKVSGGVDVITFNSEYLLKDPLPGTAEGLSRTVYMGGNNGVTVNAGFPLLEGQSRDFTLEPGAELWGIANESVTMNVFELQ